MMKRRQMMTRRQIEAYIAEWEAAALKYSQGVHASRLLWNSNCDQIWTAEFISGKAAEDGYQQPQERIPFQEVRNAA